MTGRQKTILLFSLLAALLAVMSFSPVFGTDTIAISKVIKVILSKLGLGYQVTREETTFIWDIRIPRILLAALVGGSLATSGAVYQGIFRNPIVDPFILGVSSASAFGAALAIVLPFQLFSSEAGALALGISGVFISYFIAKTGERTPIVTLILAGIIVNAFFSSLVSGLQIISTSSELREIVFWLLGGFQYAGWGDIKAVAVPLAIGFLLIWALSWKLNVLSLGDEEARSLGINAEKLRIVLIILATVITALSVSKAGIIAWVGLITPHMVRLVMGPDHRYLVPASALLGALLMVICDTIARSLTTAEIPVGIVTSMIGAPYLVILLKTGRKVFFGKND